jgi:hypothetical protein
MVVAPDKAPIEARMQRYYNAALSNGDIARSDPPLMQPGNEFDDPAGVREDLLNHSDHELIEAAFRPFDLQWLWWERDTKLIQRNAEDLHDLLAPNNPLLVTDARQYKSLSDEWDALYVTTHLPFSKVTQAGCKVFPLLLTAGVSNVREVVLNAVLSESGRLGASDEQRLELATEVFFHVVAIMHAPSYRRGFRQQLAATGPRVPIPVDQGLLEASSHLGRRVASLFDPTASVDGVNVGALDARLDGIATLRTGHGRPPRREELGVTLGKANEGGRWEPSTQGPPPAEEFGEMSFDVHLNDVCAFGSVPERVAEYSVGQYPVLRKWLSYRREKAIGRPLALGEVRAFNDTARRIGALLLMRSELDTNFLLCKSAALLDPKEEALVDA